MAVKEMCSYAAYVLRLRCEYLLIVGCHLDFYYDFRLYHTIWEIATLNSLTFKTWVLLLELCSYVLYRLRYNYLLFPVYELPSWISDVRSHNTIQKLASFNYLTY